MRGLLRVWGILLLMLCFACPARAAEESVWEMVDTAQLEAAAEDVLDIPLTPDIDLDSGLAQLGQDGIARLTAIVTRATRSGGLILVIALFCGVAEAVCGTLEQSAAAVRMVGTLAVTAVAVGDVSSLMGLGAQTVERLTDFSRILMPVMTTAAVAAGSVTGAAARQMATLMLTNLLLSMVKGVLIPLVYLFVAACAGSMATGHNGLRAIADFVRWGIKTLLTWTLLLFTAYLSLSGVIAGTADRAAIRLTRFAISGMVPVVGGILSDATESVLAGAGILRNAIGIFGMLAVLAFCLVPFLHLGTQYLLYKLSSVLTSAMTQSQLARLIGDIGTAFGLILAMTGTTALLTLISIVTTVSVAAGAA